MRRRLVKTALHWFVIMLILTTSSLAPAQAIAEALAALETAQPAEPDAMPCEDMDMTDDEHSSSCDCCATSSSCDLSACLGTACLSALPRLVGAIPLQRVAVPPDAASPAAAPFDTPFRPPII
ncbi:hypothetical protein CSC76_17100 [Pseudoxanthomonas mexicana]|nr:hypothetical protein CSC76_17100 [Pseudoxanthomonas mexicana]